MKIAVYTALFGDKDILRLPLNFNNQANIDFYVFSDLETMDVFPYKLIIKKSRFQDVTKNARYYKILGDDLLNGYDYIIWHDANIQLDLNMLQNLIEISKDSYLTTFTHPHRDDFYSEAMSCIRVGKDQPLLILKQVLTYFLEGMPAHKGMYSTGVFIRNQSYTALGFMDYWWNNVLNYSRRDQLAFAFALYKKDLKITVIKDNIFDNPFAKYHLHTYTTYKDSSGKTYTSSNLSRKFSYYCVKLLRKLRKL